MVLQGEDKITDNDKFAALKGLKSLTNISTIMQNYFLLTDELTSGNVESNRSALNTILGVTPKDTCTCEKSENGKSDQPSTRCNKDTDTKTTDAASSEFASLDARFVKTTQN